MTFFYVFVCSDGGSSRADFAKLVTGTVAATAAVAAPALAKAGTGAKQNWFGVIGADPELGGGQSNYFAGPDTYSPYSPYSKGEDALYKKDDKAFMTKVKIDVLKDSQKRLQTVPGFIEGKKWEEIRSLLTAKVCACGIVFGLVENTQVGLLLFTRYRCYSTYDNPVRFLLMALVDFLRGDTPSAHAGIVSPFS